MAMASTAPQKKAESKVMSKASVKTAPKKVKPLHKNKAGVAFSATTTSTSLLQSSPAPISKPANTDKKMPSAAPAVKSIGMVLKQVRESKSLKVSDISQRLRISERYLHGIESMDAASVPEKVYTLGFVRSYAQHLGVDPEKSLVQFKAEMYDAKSFGPEKNLKILTPIDRTHMPSKKIMAFSALVLFSFLVVWGYWNQQKASNLVVEDEFSSLLSYSSDVVAPVSSFMLLPPLSENKEGAQYKIIETKIAGIKIAEAPVKE